MPDDPSKPKRKKEPDFVITGLSANQTFTVKPTGLSGIWDSWHSVAGGFPSTDLDKVRSLEDEIRKLQDDLTKKTGALQTKDISL